MYVRHLAETETMIRMHGSLEITTDLLLFIANAMTMKN